MSAKQRAALAVLEAAFRVCAEANIFVYVSTGGTDMTLKALDVDVAADAFDADTQANREGKAIHHEQDAVKKGRKVNHYHVINGMMAL